MRVWILTSQVRPKEINVEEGDNGVLYYGGRAISFPVYYNYQEALEVRITEFETLLVQLKAEIKDEKVASTPNQMCTVVNGG